MVNNKLKLVKSATAFVIGAAVLTGSFAAAGSDTAFAKSSTSVKVSNGKLVYKSTGKVVKGYKTYNKALYKDGKKLTGLYKKTYYKAGKKATGTYKSVYYKAGKAFTGVTNKTYYKAGKKATGTYKNVYYKSGKAYTGVVNKTYYKAGKKATGLYKGVYYKTGKAATGIFEGQLYVSGNLSKGLTVYKDQLYKDAVLNKGLALFKDQLYKDAALNKGLEKFEDKFYFDAAIADGTYLDADNVERAFENGVEVGAKAKTVEAINATQVLVTFNKSLDKDTAETAANYKFNDTALTTTTAPSVELQKDKKSVIITLAAAQANDTAFSIKVDGVKDASGTVIKSNAFKVLVNDITAPEVTEVSYDGTNVVYTFSEPLKNDITNVIARVAGNPVSAGITIAGNTVSVPATIAKSVTASLYLTGIQDTAGNEIAPYNGYVTAPNDTVAPTIDSIQQIGQYKVRVVLSEKLSSTNDFDSADVKVLQGSNVVSGKVTVAKNTDFDSTGKTYDLTLDSAQFAFGTADSQALTFMIDAESFADAAGNKNAAYTKQLTLTKDASAPSYVSSKVSTDGKSFELKYNEDLKAGITPTAVVTDANGVRHIATTSVNGDVLSVSLGGTVIASGTYTVKVTGVTDEFDNETTTHSATITVGNATDTVKPVATISNKATAKNTFTVAYGEEVTSSALSASNYTLDGAALPAGTDIYFTNSDKNTVEIVLPVNSINIGSVGTGTSALLKVSNVADLAGNVIDATAKNVTVEDNTSAKITNLQVVGTDVYVTFNENITIPSTTNAADIFTIKDGTTALVAAGVSDVTAVTGNAKQLKFTLTAAPTGTISATILSSQTTLTDANGYVVK
ncbi:hypothetical protein [Viridibacillus arvi]|uniref:hypothetical protein n=1 Tax=Viridibacillus arvi TaxID=263475 RepID=UPI003D2A1BB8